MSRRISKNRPEDPGSDSGRGAGSGARAVGVQDQEAGFWTRRIFRQIRRRLGRVPLSSRIQARDPKLLYFAAGMSHHLATSGDIPAKLKELAQLKVATLVGCPL